MARGRLQYVSLNASLIPVQPEIALPLGAPGVLCLYADFRPSQLDTLVYLCNAGLEVLSEVTVVIDNTSMFSFYQSEPAKRWANVDATRQKYPPQVRSMTYAGNPINCVTLKPNSFYAQWQPRIRPQMAADALAA